MNRIDMGLAEYNDHKLQRAIKHLPRLLAWLNIATFDLILWTLIYWGIISLIRFVKGAA